jgi:hypothetical protein
MESVKHTWYNKHAHIFRTDGRVVRATLKQIVIINESAIYIKAEFVDDKGKTRSKEVSPLTIAALQVLWENVDVVSDVELPEDLENETSFIPPRECDRLPVLGVSYVPCIPTKCMLIEVNHFMVMSTISNPGNPAPIISATPVLPRSRLRRRKPIRRRIGQGTD